MSEERWTPHATVATIVEKDGKYLLVEEDKPQGIVYNQPAGHIEQGETVEEAALRETLEESRWTVKLKHLVGLYTYTAPSNGITYHRYCFAAEPVKHNPDAQLDEGILDAKWFSWDEIKDMKNLRSPLVKQCFKDHVEGKAFPLDLIYEHQEAK